ncbi:MAG: hypothetical protein EZS28_042199, partial [Streblomastix strix]
NQGRSSAIPQDKEKIVLPKIIKQKEKQKDSLQPTYSTLEEWENDRRGGFFRIYPTNSTSNFE